MSTTQPQSNSAQLARAVLIKPADSDSPKQVNGDAQKSAQRPDISDFDNLPNSALVAIDALSAVIDIGVSSSWRNIKIDPDFPQPIHLSAGCTRFNVGDIRGYLTKKVSMSAKPMRAQQLKGQVAA